MRARIEWAVIQPIFRGTRIVKEGLKSRDEAQAWLEALQITRKRTNYEQFLMTDGNVVEEPYKIAWRVVDGWHSPDEEPPA